MQSIVHVLCGGGNSPRGGSVFGSQGELHDPKKMLKEDLRPLVAQFWANGSFDNKLCVFLVCPLDRNLSRFI